MTLSVRRRARSAGAAALVAVLFLFAPCAGGQELAEDGASSVSEPELKLYIDVYGAMQSDHDLTIDGALSRLGNGMSLEQFRELERRIQRQDQLVERVREALLEQAKSRASSVAPTVERANPDDTKQP